MKITRLSAPANPPVTAAQVAEWTRLDSDQDQLTIDMLLAAATAMVENFTNTILAPTDFKIDFDCVACVYDIPVAPLSQITSVEVAGEALDASAWNLRCGKLILNSRPSEAPVVYATAGWTSVPAPLVYAITVLVSAGYDNRNETASLAIKSAENLCAPYRRLAL